MTDTITRNKHVGASGNGGQFASHSRTESNISLGGPEYIALDSDIMDDLPNERAIDFEVSWRSGEREIRDATAVAIAQSLAGPDYPAMSELAETGYARRDDVYNELSEINEGRYRMLQRHFSRLDAMFTWLIHGGDNS